MNSKVHRSTPTGTERWNELFQIDSDNWRKIFKAVPKLARENKSREFQFKFLHRIVVTKKELFRYGIKDNGYCLYCGELDSIEHTFIECQFTKCFVRQVVNWFNTSNNANFNPVSEEILFGLSKQHAAEGVVRKFSYTLLFMKYYIYSSKLNENPIIISEFINSVLFKYKIEKLN